MNAAEETRPPLDGETLATLLTGTGARVDLLAECPSTNALAADRARAGHDEGLVVVTDHQTSGRGRLDRSWVTPARAALTFSVLLRPTVPAGRWPWLPLLTGHAVRRGLAAEGIEVGLKWPNDVLVADRKLAGILVERIETARGPAAVVGIGLNVTSTAEEIPVPTGTSVLIATGRAPDRHRLLAGIVAALLEEYALWQRAETDDHLRGDYLAGCVTVGRDVRVELPGGRTVTGVATGVDAEGRLLVAHADGDLVVGAGDVVHVRAADK